MSERPMPVTVDAPDAMVPNSSKSIPPLLHVISQDAATALEELVQRMFNGADDVLFGMSERARDEDDREAYFESMRSIRLARAGISQSFIAAFHRRFEKTVGSDGASGDDDDLDEALKNLSLVQDDELEVSVAVAGIVSKVTAEFSLEIMQITARIDSICGAREITEQSNPIAPHQIASAFLEATVELDVDIKTRIILLKLFEQCALDGMGGLYTNANDTLINEGILPDLRVEPRKSASDGAERSSEQDDPGAPADSGAPAGGGASGADYEFGVLQSLLAQARGPAPPTPQANAGPPVPTPVLMTALTELQSVEGGADVAIDEVLPPMDLRQLVLARAAGDSTTMSQGDDDVLNLVEMLFNEILNDQNLAIPMKALISRLQIPILKVAIMDKSFFNVATHPTRQFLNELSSASIGWSTGTELKRDGLYNLIESTVMRVLDDFTDNPELFEELLQDLRNFVAKDQKRNALVEKRVRDSESGKAKTQAFKATVQRMINQKASGLRLSPDLGHFVRDIWSRVLVYVCVKFGANGEEWRQAAETLDDLLWSAQPLTVLEDIERRESSLPSLIERLHEGFSYINAGQATHDMLATISATLEKISQHDRAFLDDKQLPSPRDDYEELEEVVLTSPPKTEILEDEPEPKYLEQIEMLAEGAWIEMTTASGEPMRCKLATIVQPGDIYVFVNRRGMKVAERSMAGLAVDLQRESLTLLDESEVFDRALETVIGSLRNMHADASGAIGAQ